MTTKTGLHVKSIKTPKNKTKQKTETKAPFG